MLEEEGVVIDTMGAIARVVVEKKSTCVSCSAASICHPPAQDYLDAENRVGAVQGQRVKIVVSSERYIMASLLLYGIPVFVFFTAAVIGKIIAVALVGETYSDLWAFVTACFFTGLTFSLIIHFHQKSQSSRRLNPIITEVLG